MTIAPVAAIVLSDNLNSVPHVIPLGTDLVSSNLDNLEFPLGNRFYRAPNSTNLIAPEMLDEVLAPDR